MRQQHVAILGSTGSIGTQSLSVCKHMGIPVEAIAAGSNVKLLEQQAREFRPRYVVIREESRYPELKQALADTGVQVLAGAESICKVASLDSDQTVVNAIVGIAGLRPTLAALEAGNTLALANKEALITGGSLVMDLAARKNKQILPIDSEHSAVFQSIRSGRREDAGGMILTASGGPFVGKTKEELADVTVEDALRHPNWSMGAKISIDSATLMNKGLEFIEAMWLFGFTPDQIQVVIHHQSVIHSAVEFRDGSVIAQMGVPDMRCAIQYALTYPAHLPGQGERLRLTDYGKLTFEEPDMDTFVCLDACIRAARKGGLYPTIANGANEQAVELFLDRKISFLQIGELVSRSVDELAPTEAVTLETIEEADRTAREFVMSQVSSAAYIG